MLYSSPNNMASVSKVIIIGGGIGGLTLARACLDAGIAVELYEKRGLDVMLSGPGGIFIQRNAKARLQALAIRADLSALLPLGRQDPQRWVF